MKSSCSGLEKTKGKMTLPEYTSNIADACPDARAFAPDPYQYSCCPTPCQVSLAHWPLQTALTVRDHQVHHEMTIASIDVAVQYVRIEDNRITHKQALASAFDDEL